MTLESLDGFIENRNWPGLFDFLDKNETKWLSYQEFWIHAAIRSSKQLSDALNKFDVRIIS